MNSRDTEIAPTELAQVAIRRSLLQNMNSRDTEIAPTELAQVVKVV